MTAANWLHQVVTSPDLTDECVDWPYVKQNGYGRLMWHGRRTPAAHVALHYDGRPKPTIDHPLGVMALHSCDNPACVNPRHLRWGTHDENMAERRKRTPKNRRKLLDHEVREIRQQCRAGDSQAAVGRRFGISQSVVNRIMTGRRYFTVADERRAS